MSPSPGPSARRSGDPDAITLGSGPSGPVAACLIARAGLRVLVLEANDTIGGGIRTAELTVPGFRHDLCSAFHPLAQVGPISELPLAEPGANAARVLLADLRVQELTGRLGGLGRNLPERGRRLRQVAPAAPGQQRGRAAGSRW